jgi:acyl transferase domain-containing protein/acyl-CoA synthetase (AMP-forming)/AMP-acid ligase II/acyl carrier protein
MLYETAHQYPHKTALIYNQIRLSYSELYRRVCGFSRGVASLGARPGDCVAIILPNCIEYSITFFASAQSGYVALPINPLLKPHEIKQYLIECNARVIVTDAQRSRLLQQIVSELDPPIALVVIDDQSTAQHYFGDLILEHDKYQHDGPVHSGDVLYQFSSGSTGRPKRIARTQQQLRAEAEQFTTTTGLTAEANILCLVPLFHAHGLGNCLLAAVYSGATLTILEPVVRDNVAVEVPFVARAERVLQLIEQERITVLPAVPYIFSALADVPHSVPANLSTLQLCFSAGNFLAKATFDRFFQRYGIPIRQLYGCTEAGSVSINLDQDIAATWDSVGQPLKDIDVVIVDDESCALPVGQIGEVTFRSAALTSGYINLPDLNQTAFRDGYFFTGDLGKKDAQGRLYITGRKKIFIDTGGHKVDPLEVEDTLLEHPAVREVVVVGVKSAYGGEIVKAVIVPSADCDQRQILAFCRSKLADFKVPRIVQLVESIPKSPLGKILRKDLVQDDMTDQPTPDVSLRAALSAAQPARRVKLLEEYVQHEVSQLLPSDHPQIDLHKSLSDLGLDSVTAVQLKVRLEHLLGLPLSATLVWNYPNISALAHYLANTLAGEPNFGVAASQPEAALLGEARAASVVEPIAIIGIGCRFPGGANDPEAVWKILHDAIDAIVEIPDSRWNANAFYSPNQDAPGKIATRWGGFVDQVDQFDFSCFGISPREAERMDPQQRLLLEVAWEALERAGLQREQLAGSATGVFVGVSNSDYFQLQLDGSPISDPYMETGTRNSFAAGRLSYIFDLRGPSVTLDTVCSSSLVAVHLACQSLRAGESTIALAGGVNLLLSPITSVMASKWGMMATDGRCKAFDARADGFVRSEGCGVIVLKPLSAALAAGDPILALIHGSAVNQDGRSTRLTAPNGQAQQELIRQALRNAQVDPKAISYVEAHGSGTALGDPIEVEALTAVLGQQHPEAQTCLVGSIKTNFGHLEAAAGVAGLIKAVLALQHETIPANLHFTSLNPHISLDGTRLALPTTRQPWPASDTPRYAGVSSFGLSGTNAHIVLGEAPRTARSTPTNAATQLDQAYLLPLSAQSPAALKALAQSYRALLSGAPAPAIHDLAYTASLRRTHHRQRLALVGSTLNDFCDKLDAFLQDEDYAGLVVGEVDPVPQKLVFVFPGQGAQWFGMGRQLLAHEPIFRAALEKCDDAISEHVDWSIVEQLTAPIESSRLNEIDVIQPTLWAIQVALAALLRAWGVVPDAVVGHSMGEIAAAYVAGALSLPDAARVICRRSRLLRRISNQGAMLAADISLAQAEQLLKPYSDQVSIAVSNSSQSTVLAGDPAVLELLRAQLEAAAVFCRWVKVDVAAHSPQVEPLRAELRSLLADMRPQTAALPFYSTVRAEVTGGPELGTEYWVQNLREPVLFGATVRRLIDDGYAHFIELSPHPLLLPAIREGLLQQERQGLALPSLQREADERAALLDSLATLYTRGHAVDWTAFYPAGGTCIQLPTYPWQRQHCWFTPSPTGAIGGTWHRPAETAMHPLLGVPIPLAATSEMSVWHNTLVLSNVPYLADHRVHDTIIFPAAAYIEMALAAAQTVFGPGAHQLAQLELRQMLVLAEDHATQIQTIVSAAGPNAATIEIFTRRDDASNDWILHARSALRRGSSEAKQPDTLADTAELQAGRGEHIAGEAHYAAMATHELHYGAAFRGIQQIWRQPGEALAQVSLPSAAGATESYQIHPALLDACLQAFTTAAFGIATEFEHTAPHVPISFQQIQMLRPFKPGQLQARIRLQAGGDTAPGGDLDLLDGDGQLILSVRGLCTQRLEPTVSAAQSDPLSTWLYSRGWQQQPLAPATNDAVTAPATWLILADRQGVGQQVASLLTERGHRVVLALQPGAPQPGAHIIDPNDPTAYVKLVRHVMEPGQPACKGIIHLWSLHIPPDADPETAQPLSGWGSALALAQALISVGTRARLWLVTRGAQAVGPSLAPLALAQSPLWGLGLTIAQEHPPLNCSRVDLSLEPSQDEPSALVAELEAGSLEDQIALRPDGRYVARLSQWSPTAEQPRVRAGEQAFRLETTAAGQLDKLVLRAATRPRPGPGQVEIEVVAAGLNFRDVLIALNALPAQLAGPELGGECAGRIIAVGPDVTDLHVGQAVVALADNSFSTFVIADARFVLPKPEHLSFTEAATIPVAFLTAYYALRHVGRLMPGERVLIHAATGGVGLAALQIARQCGAEIFATAGSPEKRALLRELGVTHVLDSRSLNFVDQIRRGTDGEGVDVVLNSLGGQFIEASLELLADYGRFIELGKRDYYDDRKLRLKPFLKNLSFTLVDLHGMIRQRPQIVSRLFRDMMALVADGTFTPTLRQVVPVAQIGDAFHMMAQARHIGKIAISFEERAEALIEPQAPEQSQIRPHGSYLITGGLGGIGLTVARWLVAQGARSLVLLGRSRPSAAALAVIADLEEQGAQIMVRQVDVTDRRALAALLAEAAEQLPPIRGVMHAAGVLRDATLPQLSVSSFKEVLAPKVLGAWHLDQLTRGLALDFFVLFSSVASLIGAAGQGNYAAANAFLDSLAYHRRAQGLPAITINWGAWREVGLATTQSNRGARLQTQGIASFTSAQGVQLLGQILQHAPVQIGAVSFNLRQWQQAHPGLAGLPFFADVRQVQATETSQDGEANNLRLKLQAVEPDQRAEMLQSHLRDQIALVLRLPARQVNPKAPLGSMGFDSLLALELRNRLEASLGLSLSGTLIWGYPTIAALVPYLAEKMGIELQRATPVAPVVIAEQATPAQQDPLDLLIGQDFMAELEQLSDDEVRRMLSAS